MSTKSGEHGFLQTFAERQQFNLWSAGMQHRWVNELFIMRSFSASAKNLCTHVHWSVARKFMSPQAGLYAAITDCNLVVKSLVMFFCVGN